MPEAGHEDPRMAEVGKQLEDFKADVEKVLDSNPIMKHFEFAHLPPHLQKVSAPVCALAEVMAAKLPGCAEKSAGLRKLLEAKDCFVRAALEK